MTHTLHRTRNVAAAPEEYILFTMAAQGFNNEGSADKFRRTVEIMLRHSPDNIGDDNIGSIFSGETIETILAHANGKSYVAAVYSNKEKADACLRDLKAAALGLSVVMTGNRERIFSMLADAGLAPHTVNLSLGYMGRLDKLPAPEILDITSMCGHGMVCADHVKYVIRQVEAGRMTAKQGAADLARPCTCAMFNPARAEAVITSVCHRHDAEGDDGGDAE